MEGDLETGAQSKKRETQVLGGASARVLNLRVSAPP